MSSPSAPPVNPKLIIIDSSALLQFIATEQFGILRLLRSDFGVQPAIVQAVESSLVVDCEATPEMLETIFFPNNAIHDGGVIIKGDRIAFAACIFPLTRRQDLNKTLGTRHRAAIGLSEETDAVVVVVSEETGAISYAYKGQFVRGVTLEELRAFLTSVLLNPARSRNWLGWLRSWTSDFVKPGPAAVAKADSAAAPTASEAGK